MYNTGPARAWNFLQRNPDFIEDRLRWAEPAQAEHAPFPLRQQTEGDLEAASWGLLAWADPQDEAGTASPFWAAAPTLEAMPAAGAPALVDLLDDPEVRLSGLRFSNGAVIVKIEKGEASIQFRIADGAAFDPAGGVEIPRLRPSLDLLEEMREVTRLWPIGRAAAKKDAAGRISRTIFSWLSTAVSPARAIA